MLKPPEKESTADLGIKLVDVGSGCSIHLKYVPDLKYQLDKVLHQAGAGVDSAHGGVFKSICLCRAKCVA